MQGKILDFDIVNDKGIISGINGERYNFSSDNWKDSTSFPKKGLLVDFEQNAKEAKNIYVIEQSIKILPRKDLTALVSSK